jgi:hypothetical protein
MILDDEKDQGLFAKLTLVLDAVRLLAELLRLVLL